MKDFTPVTRSVPCPQCGETMGWDDTEPGPCKECEEANKDSRIAELEKELADLKAKYAGLVEAVGKLHKQIICLEVESSGVAGLHLADLDHIADPGKKVKP